MVPERYVVFDVETPNSANDRISAIGVTVIEDGCIVQELSTLVDPETHFDPFNISLTGITPAMVAGQPSFPILWQLLEPIFNRGILAAHNAPFDLRVLSCCLHTYGIHWRRKVLVKSGGVACRSFQTASSIPCVTILGYHCITTMQAVTARPVHNCCCITVRWALTCPMQCGSLI